MVVTFDFDDTLLWKRYVRDEDGEIDEVVIDGPNPEGLSLLRQAIRDGHEVHIVTTRYEKMRDDTIEWLRKWKVLDGIAKIHFTNGQLKRDTLTRIGSSLHHDDDEEELENLPPGCRGVQLFPHPSQVINSRMTNESSLLHLIRSLIREAKESTVPLVLDRFSYAVLYHNEIAYFENIPGFNDAEHLRFYADWKKGRRHYSGYRFLASRASLQYLVKSIDNAIDIIIHNQLDWPSSYPDAKRQMASLRRLDVTVKDLLLKMPA